MLNVSTLHVCILQTRFALKGYIFKYVCSMDLIFWQDLPVNKSIQLTTCWMWAPYKCVFYRPDFLYRAISLNVFVALSWHFDRIFLSIRAFSWQHAECEHLTNVYFNDQIFFKWLYLQIHLLHILKPCPSLSLNWKGLEHFWFKRDGVLI